MKFDYKVLIRLMKKSYKGGGIKIIRTERELRDYFFLSGAGWALLIPKEKCPGEVTGQIVTWLADLPRIGYAAWVVKGFDPKPLEPAERDLAIADCTALTYNLGMKPLPLRTETEFLVQLGNFETAAFDLDAFAVVSGGANLGAFDPGVILARWTDEDTEAWFWIWNDITNVPEIARTAATACRVWHTEKEN